jgi:urease accessory protein UreF
MKLRNILAVLAAGATMALPITASAQFGGLVKQAVPGLGGKPAGAPAADIDGFLANAMLSTKNVMIASALLSAAVQKRTDNADLKKQLADISGKKSLKELNTYSAPMTNDIAAIANQKNAEAALSERYQSATAEQKQMIANALVNLAIGIARNVVLAGQAPNMLSNLTGNPANLGKLGEVKAAAELIAVQAKGLATIAPALPKLMSSVKIKAETATATTPYKPVSADAI